ncbi:MAG: CoA transferase [Dehalococcoidia bacterium]
MAGAFHGIRILDFSQGIPGPMATMFLGDFDAEVIKVEPPGGDRMRHHPGYLCWNRNKLRLTLDLDTYEGLRAARDLLATADVAVFDSRPGALERRGLDAGSLLAANPALLHAWLPHYTARGRWSQLPQGDALLSAVTGTSHLQFSWEDVPVYLVAPMLSYHYAMITATAIAAGLYERRRTGRGQALQVSGLHAFAAAQSGSAIRAGEIVRMRATGARGGVPNYRLYQCADGKWLFLGTLTAKFFLNALQALDLLEILTWEGVDGEHANMLVPPMRDKVIAKLDERFAEKPRDEWLRILREHDVPRAPVGDRETWFHGEVVAANEMRVELEHPDLGPVEMPGVPVKLSETPGSVRHLPRDVTLADLPPHRPTVEAEPGAPFVAPAPGGPLDGVRVLDLGGFIAGTFGPTVLANFGADVIKVEPLEGDPFRAVALSFVGHNQGKRGLAIDLKHPDGLAAFYDMVRGADLVLDNYRAGVLQRLKVDYETLRGINPRITSCSVTGYGRGPYANEPGFDPLVQAESGIMAAQGGDDEPVFYQLAVNDESSAIMAAFGMIAALYAREATGRGQRVETALANQSVMLQSGELTSYAGAPPRPIGGRDCAGIAALNRFYQCADGWLVVACERPKHFPRLAMALGHPEWCGRYTAEQALAEPVASPLADAIAEAVRELPLDDVIDRLTTARVPCAPALELAELWESPWFRGERFAMESDHPQFGRMDTVRAYAEWSRTPSEFRRRAPLLGEHSREVLESFGIDGDRVERLLGSGVVRQG